MNRSARINIILFIVFVSFGVIYFKYDTGRKEKIRAQLASQYPELSFGQSMEGTVTAIEHPYPHFFNEDPFQAYLFLNDSIRLRIKTGGELKTSASLDDILRLGDRLVKNASTDSLFIQRISDVDTLGFCFLLRDDLGYPLRKDR